MEKQRQLREGLVENNNGKGSSDNRKALALQIRSERVASIRGLVSGKDANTLEDLKNLIKERSTEGIGSIWYQDKMVEAMQSFKNHAKALNRIRYINKFKVLGFTMLGFLFMMVEGVAAACLPAVSAAFNMDDAIGRLVLRCFIYVVCTNAIGIIFISYTNGRINSMIEQYKKGASYRVAHGGSNGLASFLSTIFDMDVAGHAPHLCGLYSPSSIIAILYECVPDFSMDGELVAKELEDKPKQWSKDVTKQNEDATYRGVKSILNLVYKGGKTNNKEIKKLVSMLRVIYPPSHKIVGKGRNTIYYFLGLISVIFTIPLLKKSLSSISTT